jgi:hypothetical protein
VNFSARVRRSAGNAGVHGFFGAAATLLPALLVLTVYRGERAHFFTDSEHLLISAERFVVEGRFPLHGNPFFLSVPLGPLANILTALPQFFVHRLLASYAFIWALYLLSVPLFYFAAWRFVRDAPAAFAAALWFGICGMSDAHLLESPLNTSFLPLFLAFYAGRLFRRPEKAGLLWLYLAIGLAVQTHMTAVCLIPSSVIFLWRGKRDFLAQLPWHLLGLAIVVALHATAIYDIAHARAEFAVGDSRALFVFPPFDAQLFLATLRVGLRFYLPLLLATPAFVLARAALVPGAAELRVKLAAILVFQALAAALFTAYKTDGGDRYFLKDLPFLALGLAVALQAARQTPQPGRRRLAALFPAAGALVVVATLAHYRIEAQQPWRATDVRVSAQHAVAAQLDRWLQENQLASVAVANAYWHMLAFGEIHRIPQMVVDQLPQALFCLEYPHYCRAAAPEETVYEVAFEYREESDLRNFLAASAGFFTHPERCGGPFAAGPNLAVFFCRGRDDPRQPAARVADGPVTLPR